MEASTAMSNDNYPAGVSDNHPHFNPPREVATGVECGADSALVVPSFQIKADLYELRHTIQRLAGRAGADMTSALLGIDTGLEQLIEKVNMNEQEREYECPFHDDIDLEESECAQWVCPVCGNDRETDTLPEDVDPDRAYDEMRDARYDD